MSRKGSDDTRRMVSDLSGRTGINRVSHIDTDGASRTKTDQWLSRQIEQWFERAARPLPWRRRRTPWRAFVAEVMLQQTQVVRVVERFESFMKLFPTPRTLADATEHAVLVAWQGMGYYRRAKLLRRAAIGMVQQHGGRVPRSAEALRELPGVGRYTAGAIASIVFGAREPIVDGNVARVILRVRGIERPLRDAKANEHCWRDADALVQAARDPAALNEGLMELGATICTPMRPRCEACPIRAACRAFADSSVDRIPAPPRGRPPKRVNIDTVVVHDASRDRVLLVKRPDEGMWGSMWETPELTQVCAQGAPLRRAETTSRLRRVGAFRHLTTHRDFRVRVFAMEVSSAGNAGRADGACAPSRKGGTRALPDAVTRWVSRSRLTEMPISNATRRVLDLVLGPSRRQ